MIGKNSMKHFCSHLNMEDLTDVDYAHTKRVYKDLEIII